MAQTHRLGLTPLHYAAEKEASAAVLRLLLEAGGPSTKLLFSLGGYMSSDHKLPAVRGCANSACLGMGHAISTPEHEDR